MDDVPGWVLRRLRELPAMEVEAEVPDRLSIRRGGSRTRFRVRSRARISEEEAGALPLSQGGIRVLWAVRSLAEGTRRRLAERGASWVERERGIVHLDAPRLYVHVEGARPDGGRRSSRTLSFAGASGLIVESLLERFGPGPFTLNEVVELVPVTKGRVSQVLTLLVEAGLVRAEGRTRTRLYTVEDPGRLLDAWAGGRNAAPEVAVRLYAWTRAPLDLYRKLAEEMEPLGIRWAIGGVAAANLYAPVLSVLPAPEVWVQADVPVERVAGALGAEVVREDEPPSLVVWQREGDPALAFAARADDRIVRSRKLQGLRLVTRSRAYVETRGSGVRAADVAEALREEMGV